MSRARTIILGLLVLSASATLATHARAQGPNITGCRRIVCLGVSGGLRSGAWHVSFELLARFGEPLELLAVIRKL